jgi:chemotaxis protein histidine kinase CheA
MIVPDPSNHLASICHVGSRAVQTTTKQQILGYFIEEAKEHLDHIEQGLVDLQSTMADPEQVNNLFRAAHSVKGGAAMLGFESIQKTAHHFEECFKILKEHPVHIDQKIEDLFLKGFDTLKALIEGLQGPFGLREEDAQQAVQEAEPTFMELEKYLHSLINRQVTPPATVGTNPVKPVSSTVTMGQAATVQVNNILRLMLQLFREEDTSKSRQQLTMLSQKLGQLNSSESWTQLILMAQKAIANTRNPYTNLTPIIIKELKQASDLLIAGRCGEICPSRNLQKLAPPTSGSAAAPASPPPLPVGQAISAKHPSTNAKHPQISIPREPRAAARSLLEVFSKTELIEIAEFLMKAIQ